MPKIQQKSRQRPYLHRRGLLLQLEKDVSNQPWAHTCYIKQINDDNETDYDDENKENDVEVKKKNKEKKFNSYIFFDYLTYEHDDETDKAKFGRHIQNLVCARKVCKNCLDLSCIFCEKRIFIDETQFC